MDQHCLCSGMGCISCHTILIYWRQTDIVAICKISMCHTFNVCLVELYHIYLHYRPVFMYQWCISGNGGLVGLEPPPPPSQRVVCQNLKLVQNVFKLQFFKKRLGRCVSQVIKTLESAILGSQGGILDQTFFLTFTPTSGVALLRWWPKV